MRVISGIYKRRRFDVPHSFKARPTTDFAKENLFNVLSNYMDFEDGIRALDVERITPERYLLLVETGDEVLDYRQAVERYAGCRQVVVDGGEHGLRSFPEHLPQLFEFCGL